MAPTRSFRERTNTNRVIVQYARHSLKTTADSNVKRYLNFNIPLILIRTNSLSSEFGSVQWRIKGTLSTWAWTCSTITSFCIYLHVSQLVKRRGLPNSGPTVTASSQHPNRIQPIQSEHHHLSFSCRWPTILMIITIGTCSAPMLAKQDRWHANFDRYQLLQTSSKYVRYRL